MNTHAIIESVIHFLLFVTYLVLTAIEITMNTHVVIESVIHFLLSLLYLVLAILPWRKIHSDFES
jgi:hypothetical protein